MKKSAMLCLLGVLSLILAPSAMNAGQFSFRLFGGGGYLSGGDLNKGLQGWEDFYTGLYDYNYSAEKTGSFNPVHLGFNFGGDVVFRLNSNWAVGLGTEFLEAKKTTNILFQSPAKTWDWEYYGKLSAVPLILSVFYFLPLDDKFTLEFHAGLGYYFAKTQLDSRTKGSETDTYIIDAKANGLGFHGGVGLEMKLASNVSLLVEAAGRYASISGFTGNVTMGGGGGWDGTLYYFEGTTSYFGNYSYIDLNISAPSGEAFTTVREAKIDFSGLSFRVGVVIGI
jgi:hypothetical protein